MQQAIPYKSWIPIHANNTTYMKTDHLLSKGSSSSSSSSSSSLSPPPPSSSSTSSLSSSPPPPSKNTSNLVLENAVVVVAKGGCCMGQVVRRLLLTHGVNPLVHEVRDQEGDEGAVLDQLPVVYIGGRLFGGLDKIISAHITGELVPVLKQAGALWL